MAVDFGAKRWRSISADWYLRFAKLVTTRKILFAGSLTALFLTNYTLLNSSDELHPHPKMIRHLKDQFDRPPLARLMTCYEHVDTNSKVALGQILQC